MLFADLHVHLDGSLRDSTFVELARERGIVPSLEAGEALLERLRFRPGMSLKACLERFAATVGLLQTADAVERVASELIEDSFLDGVRHLEVRLCPELHTREGMALEEAIESALMGLERGIAAVAARAPGDRMFAGLVVTALEGWSEEEAGRAVDVALRYRDSGILGIDLAGDESLFDPAPFRTAFARAREAGLGIAVHAGEGCEPSHVSDAVVALGAMRVGHGVAAARDPKTLELLATKDVTIECCLTSNVHTGAIPSIAEHPLQAFAAAGVGVVLCTDNTLFSATTLSREFDLARSDLGLGTGQIEDVVLESARASFLRGAERAELERLLAGGLAAGGLASA